MPEIKLLPHQVPPTAPDYDLWTIWGDRGAGKTFAAMAAAAGWASAPVMMDGTMKPARVAVFVREFINDTTRIVERLTNQGTSFRFDRARCWVEFDNGARWMFFPFHRSESAKGHFFSHAWIEDSEKADRSELEEIFRNLRRTLRWGEAPHIVMTCRYLPPWSVHMLAGGRNYLTVAGNAEINPGLPKSFLEAVDEERRRDAR